MKENKLLTIDQLLAKELIVFMFKQKNTALCIFDYRFLERTKWKCKKNFEFNLWKKSLIDQDIQSAHKALKNSS